MLLTNKHINDILIAKSGKAKRCSSPTAQAPAQIRQYKSLQIELKKEIVMFFTKLFGNMFMDMDRRCTGNKLDLKTTARFYRAFANM